MITNLFVQTSYSWETTLGLTIAAFGLGFAIKSAVIFSQRKRVLRLEDEMLANHARILALEKRVAESRKEKNNYHADFELKAVTAEQGVKVS